VRAAATPGSGVQDWIHSSASTVGIWSLRESGARSVHRSLSYVRARVQTLVTE
jgi:hypothetical protein